LRFAQRFKPLIIFDSLIAFSDADEQSATEMRRHLTFYRRLADLGATVLLLHHTGKSENSKQYRGSSDIKASVDSAFLLETRDTFQPGAGLGALRLVPFKTRHAPGAIIRLDYADGSFHSSDTPQRTPLERLEDIIRVNPMQTGTELVKLGKPHGLAKHQISDLLLHGLQAEKFAFVPGKRGGKRYTIAEPQL
jgi:hypothetical protein